MTVEDQAFLAITSWKENREAGVPGLQSIINVIMNRAKMRNTSPFTECVRPLQFSSLTAHGDPELTVWPTEGHAADWEAWQQALALAAQAASGVLGDITDGADLYYAPHLCQAATQPLNCRTVKSSLFRLAGIKTR